MELELEPSFLNLETFAALFRCYRSNNLPWVIKKKLETECLFSQEIQNELGIPQNSMQMCKSFGGSLALLSHQKGEIRCFCLRIMCCLSWPLHRLGSWLPPSLAAAFCQDTQEGCRPPSICAMELIGLRRKVMASEPNLVALIIFRKEQFCQKIWPKQKSSSLGRFSPRHRWEWWALSREQMNAGTWDYILQ